MGTNYYTRTNECEHCNRYEQIHLGKSSFGWKFCFNLNDKKYYKNFTELKEYLKNKVIKDEYSEIISFNDFVELIEEKQKSSKSQVDYSGIAINGYVFEDCDFS